MTLEWLQQVQLMSLNSPAVSFVAISKVSQPSCVVLEGIQQPVQDYFTKSSAVRIVEGTAMPDGNVAFPRWCTGW